MDWFINVFKKEIDSRFPTLPDREHTFIAGSSMGGLMSLYAISAYNNVFSKAACLSPSVWAGAKQLDDFIKNADIADDTVVYMDYGALEMGNHNSMAKRLSKVASLLVEKNIDLSFRIIPGGTHSEASWERQIPFFMKTLLYEAE